MPTSPLQHPFIKPPEEHEIVQSPVRDDDALGQNEDLDREPDGMPHHLIGLTVLFSVMLAMLVAVMFLTGSTVGRVAAIVLAAIAIPVLVSSLRNTSEKRRDVLHPSR